MKLSTFGASRQSRRGLAYGLHVDGADVALLLGQNQVRGQLGQKVLVQIVKAVLLRRDQLVDLGARGPGGDEVPGQERQRLDLGRKIALVSYADQVVPVPEGADELGQRREQTDDAHQRLLAS